MYDFNKDSAFLKLQDSFTEKGFLMLSIYYYLIFLICSSFKNIFENVVDLLKNELALVGFSLLRGALLSADSSGSMK